MLKINTLSNLHDSSKDRHLSCIQTRIYKWNNSFASTPPLIELNQMNKKGGMYKVMFLHSKSDVSLPNLPRPTSISLIIKQLIFPYIRKAILQKVSKLNNCNNIAQFRMSSSPLVKYELGFWPVCLTIRKSILALST